VRSSSSSRRRGPSFRLTFQRASRAAHIPADRRLRAWALAALPAKAEVTVRYVGEREGRRLNREFRGKDYATNVLSFRYDVDSRTPRKAPRGRLPGNDGRARAILGDVVICAPVVAREAREQGKATDAHHAHLLVHGLLHLQGYDHERDAEARKMERRERAILAKLGFADPY
jgi:probable rRNA maturation factor